MTRRSSTATRRGAVAAAVVALALVAGAAVGFGLQHTRDRTRTAEASASAELAARVLEEDTAARGAAADRVGRELGEAARGEARDALAAAVEQAAGRLEATGGEVADEAVRDALAQVLQRARDVLGSTATVSAADAGSVAELRALAAEVAAAVAVLDAAHDEWVAEREARRAREERATAAPRAPVDGGGRDRCETTYDGPPFYTSPPTRGGDGSNGGLPESMLQATSWGVDPLGTRYWLRTEATQALERLNVAFRAEFGDDLDLDLTYRDFATQVAMREALGSVAAVPGTSKHGTGYALDVPELPCEYGWDTPKRAWLIEHGPSYGWVQPSWALRNGSNPEYWHYEYVG